MSTYLQQKIMERLKNISHHELMTFSAIYGFSLTDSESEKIIDYLRNNTIDPFNAVHRDKVFQDLERLTNHQTAIKAQKLFEEMINLYQIEHLF